MPNDPGQPRKLGAHGGKRIKGQRGANGTLKRGSSSRAYVLARLQRDNRFDLVQAIFDGRVSCYSVAVSLGWTVRRRSIREDDPRLRPPPPAPATLAQTEPEQRPIVDVASMIG